MKSYRVWISIVSVLVMVTMIFTGCGRGTQTSVTYSISGTVSLSGTGLQGVTINLSGAASATATTDASGNYTFTGLANGSYTITPSKSGYTFSPSSSAQTVNGASITGINFTATAVTYSISGTVSLSGTGLQGVTINLSGAASATATTDASGDYSFSGLANGSYTITPSRSGYTFSPSSSAQTVNDASITSVDFTATAVTYSISGTVTFSGIGFPGVTMTLTGAGSATVTTDVSGKYTFSGLANGSYTVTPSESSYTFSPSSSTQTINVTDITGVDFTATGPGYSITGSVYLQNGGAGLPGVMLALNTNPPQTAFTDSSGNYWINNIPNGTYTLTPSLSGAEAIFYPASINVTLKGSNAPAQFFGANVGYTISGSVNYSGSQTPGRVYVDLDRLGGGGTSLGTSIASPGLFTIRGVSPGTYTLHAWMDNSIPQTGVSNALSPRGSISVNVTNGNVSGQSITLADPSPTPVSSAPTGVGAFPGNGFALIMWGAPQDANGNLLAQYYNIYYSTSSSVSPANGTKKTVQENNQDVLILSNLTDGKTYYFVVTAVLGGVESAASTPAASATIGATTGSNSVSGTVTFPITATGPMYVGVFGPTNATNPEVFLQCIASPVSPQSYSVSGMPIGTYMAFAIIDMNNDGSVDIGDISNTNEININNIGVSGNVTGVNQTLSIANASAQVTAFHLRSMSSGSDSYQLYFQFSGDNTKLLVKVSLISGPNVPVPMDIRLNSAYSGISIPIGPTRPNVGDSYVFVVTYSDGISENVTASVTAVLDSFAQNLTTSGANRNIPIFNWVAPASPPAAYTYSVHIVKNNGGQVWYYPNYWVGMPSSQTSVLFNVDGSASQASLTTGTQYNWSITVRDSNGNIAQYWTTYTP